MYSGFQNDPQTLTPTFRVAVVAPRNPPTNNAELISKAARQRGHAVRTLPLEDTYVRLDDPPKVLRLGEAAIETDVVIVDSIPADEYRELKFVDKLLELKPKIATLARPSATWARAIDKIAAGKLLEMGGVPVPQAFEVDPYDDRGVYSAFDSLGNDVWIKDPLGWGGAQVERVRNTAELLHAVSHLRGERGTFLQFQEHAGSRTREGHAFDIRAITMDGELLIAYERLQLDKGVDQTNIHQAGVRRRIFDPTERLKQIATQAAAVLDLNPGHIDLVEKNGDFRVIEAGVHGGLEGALEFGLDLPSVIVDAHAKVATDLNHMALNTHSFEPTLMMV